MEHYYSSNPSSESDERIIEYKIDNINFSFISDNGVFSKGHVDFATDFMLKTIINQVSGSVLDLGCGYGVIGIVVAKFEKSNKIIMCDINNRALNLARRNIEKNHVKNIEVIESNGFENIKCKFDTIITNPPIRAGKAVIYEMFKEAKEHLNDRGALYLVINKKHGAPSAIAYLSSIFENVEVLDKKSGFNVIKCS